MILQEVKGLSATDRLSREGLYEDLHPGLITIPTNNTIQQSVQVEVVVRLRRVIGFLQRVEIRLKIEREGAEEYLDVSSVV